MSQHHLIHGPLKLSLIVSLCNLPEKVPQPHIAPIILPHVSIYMPAAMSVQGSQEPYWMSIDQSLAVHFRCVSNSSSHHLLLASTTSSSGIRCGKSDVAAPSNILYPLTPSKPQIVGGRIGGDCDGDIGAEEAAVTREEVGSAGDAVQRRPQAAGSGYGATGMG